MSVLLIYSRCQQKATRQVQMRVADGKRQQDKHHGANDGRYCDNKKQGVKEKFIAIITPPESEPDDGAAAADRV
jgi:hypothetical protein